MASSGQILTLALLSTMALLPIGGAFAKDDDDEGAPGAMAEAEGIDTEDLFGFTLGTDTGEKGEKQLTFTLDGRFGRAGLSRNSSYSAFTGEAEFEYSLTDNLKISVGGAGSAFDIHHIFELDNMSGGGFSGGFFEVKYRFLDYRTAPIGLSLSIEPEWSRIDEVSGETATSYGIEFRLAADAEIAKDFLFAAANLVYVPEWERENDIGLSYWSSSSGLELSGAFTAQVVKDIFLGGEVRYLAAFDGATLGDRQGWGLYIGPTLYAQVTPNAYVKAALSFQVAGNPDDFWGSNLDLVNFERQQARVEVGFQF